MESQVKEPARTFYVGQENSWPIPGISNAAFIDGHVESVTPYPKGTTFIASWPGAKPGPVW